VAVPDPVGRASVRIDLTAILDPASHPDGHWF
jgi:hypothetical protein